MILNPSPAHAEDIERAFGHLIGAVPKSRRGEHAFAINEVSLILTALRRRVERKARMRLAPFSKRRKA